MKILIITPSFPPILNPESICAGKLAQALVEAGVEVTVVSQSLETYPGMEDDSPCWSGDMGRVVRLAAPWYGKKAGSLAAKTLRLDRLASWFHLAAIEYCNRLLEGERFDLVMSRAPHGDSMYAVHRLKKKFKFKWMASFADPFPTFFLPEPYGRGKAIGFFQSRQAAWARQALELADYVRFPSERLGRYMENRLGLDLGHKMIVAPHIGWRRRSEGRKDDVFDILHAGGIGLPRVSTGLFAAFADAIAEHPALREKVRISFLGHVHDQLRAFIDESGMDGLVGFESPVPFEKSLERMDRADALLLVEAPFREGIFLPSKFCDYAVCEKPLLLYSPGDGMIFDLVGSSHPGFLGQDEAGCREAFERLLTRIASGESLEDYRYARPEEFYSERVAKKLLDAVAG